MQDIYTFVSQNKTLSDQFDREYRSLRLTKLGAKIDTKPYEEEAQDFMKGKVVNNSVGPKLVVGVTNFFFVNREEVYVVFYSVDQMIEYCFQMIRPSKANLSVDLPVSPFYKKSIVLRFHRIIDLFFN